MTFLFNIGRSFKFESHNPPRIVLIFCIALAQLHFYIIIEQDFCQKYTLIRLLHAPLFLFSKILSQRVHCKQAYWVEKVEFVGGY